MGGYDFTQFEHGFCFGDKSSISSWVIPEGKKIIGTEAFKGFTGLTTITIPESIREIVLISNDLS